MSSWRRRSVLPLAALVAAPLLLALCLPPEAPGWLFWGALGASCAAGFAWGFLGLSRAPSGGDERPSG